MTDSTAPRKNFKNVGTFITEADSRAQVQALEENVKEFGLTYFGMSDRRQGECEYNAQNPAAQGGHVPLWDSANV